MKCLNSQKRGKEEVKDKKGEMGGDFWGRIIWGVFPIG